MNGSLIRQIDGCTLGDPIAAALFNIFCIKMERGVFSPLKPNLYTRYVDYIFSKQVKNQPDGLFRRLSNYHRNIKFSVEVNTRKFFNTEISQVNSPIHTSVVRKEAKTPNHWSSAIPKKYKTEI